MLSVFDIFKIGIGPSSSHTVGPMKAASIFIETLVSEGQINSVSSLKLHLFGSLAATGKGHGTDKGIILGLSGETPEEVSVQAIESIPRVVLESKKLRIGAAERGFPSITFDPGKDIVFNRRQSFGDHPNGMRFEAYDQQGDLLLSKGYFSIGGGFVRGETIESSTDILEPAPYPFSRAKDLISLCHKTGLPISTIMLENEKALSPETEIIEKLDKIISAMADSVKEGCGLGQAIDPILPGGLKIARRAPALHDRLSRRHIWNDPMIITDWINLFAIAVNEQNAAGSKVVTAPTNGAAGIIPATLEYYRRFVDGADKAGERKLLLTAAAIGILYKINASISGAEVGCQGEVGVACSMAAGGLCELLHGNPDQVENAAEIGMEHNLGLTCDPVGGLVQVPCIERNAIAAVKAVNSARMALHGTGKHFVTLDSVIRTMRQTGADMRSKYKETSRGGLAVNIVEC